MDLLWNAYICMGEKIKMGEYVIQKLELRPHPVWVDVKSSDKTLEEAIISLNNFSANNPSYIYRLVSVLYLTRSVLK